MKGMPAESAEPGGNVCEVCLTSETPEWRNGPSGPKTLCNVRNP
jgi:hypothetical protein